MSPSKQSCARALKPSSSPSPVGSSVAGGMFDDVSSSSPSRGQEEDDDAGERQQQPTMAAMTRARARFSGSWSPSGRRRGRVPAGRRRCHWRRRGGGPRPGSAMEVAIRPGTWQHRTRSGHPLACAVRAYGVAATAAHVTSAAPACAQRRRRGLERGAGRDDVVDEQDVHRLDPRVGPERRAVQPARAVLARSAGQPGRRVRAAGGTARRAGGRRGGRPAPPGRTRARDGAGHPSAPT